MSERLDNFKKALDQEMRDYEDLRLTIDKLDLNNPCRPELELRLTHKFILIDALRELIRIKEV